MVDQQVGVSSVRAIRAPAQEPIREPMDRPARCHDRVRPPAVAMHHLLNSNRAKNQPTGHAPSVSLTDIPNIPSEIS
jgi:hypothetical protein